MPPRKKAAAKPQASKAPDADGLDPSIIVRYEPKFPVAELQEWHVNARKGNVAMIAESIAVNGMYRPVIANIGTHTGRPNEVLAGNHTFKGAIKRGATTVPVAFVDVDENAARKIVAVDNKANDDASYDKSILAELLAPLEDDLAGTGFSMTEFEKLVEEQGPAPDESDLVGDQTFSIVVECDNEAHQLELLQRFGDEGLAVKAMVV